MLEGDEPESITSPPRGKLRHTGVRASIYFGVMLAMLGVPAHACLLPCDFGGMHQLGGGHTVLGFGGLLGFLMGKMRVIPPPRGVKVTAAPDSGLPGTKGAVSSQICPMPTTRDAESPTWGSRGQL